MAGYDRSLIRDRGEVESGFLGSLVDVEVVCAGSVKAEEEIGKQLIVIRRRTFTVRRLTEALSRNINASRECRMTAAGSLSVLLGRPSLFFARFLPIRCVTLWMCAACKICS